MQRNTDREETSEAPRFPLGMVLEPPVSVEDLIADTEYDPDGAEEFVELIRALRQERGRSHTL